jgi:hypothetical protein
MSLKDKFILWWYRKELDESYYDEHIEDPTLDVLIKRVKLLFKLHGVAETEIPEFYKDITLKDLNSDALLIEKLTPEFLQKLADFFGIRIEWLRSGEPELFYTRDWYKDRTKNFFEDLKQTDFDLEHNPFEIITTQKSFDIQSEVHQPFILVIKIPIACIGDRMIYRYMVESEWHWHHAPCRLGAKAIATRYYQLTGRMIYIQTTTKDNFKRLSSQLVTPNFGKGMNHDISFEEYGALEFRHLEEPYESFEYDAIIEEISYRGLEQIQYEYLKSENASSSRVKIQEDKSQHREAAFSSHQKHYQIKKECINFYMTLPKNTSNVQGAKKFLESLSKDSEEKLKFLSSSNRELFFTKAISEFKNQHKMLAKGTKIPRWLELFNNSK